MIAKFLGGVFDFEEDSPGTFEKRGAGFRENGLSPETVEKFMSNFTFQFQNLLA